jgi:hypothetical protein
VNLLDRFVLHHLQLTLLKVEVIKVVTDPGTQEAKVELNLSPRLIQADSGESLPSYHVSARLACRSGPKGAAEGGKEASFKAQVGFEAVYRQVSGEPVDIAEFTANHASLTRQLYPLLQQELRALMTRVGLEQIRLPFDLAAQVDSTGGETVQVSGSVH